MSSVYSLMQLPNELILRVIDHVHPSDIEALALYNKAIRMLATNALDRHERLKKEYNQVTLGNTDEWQRALDGNIDYLYDERPLSLVADILSDSDIAYCPVELRLGPNGI